MMSITEYSVPGDLVASIPPLWRLITHIGLTSSPGVIWKATAVPMGVKLKTTPTHEPITSLQRSHDTY